MHSKPELELLYIWLKVNTQKIEMNLTYAKPFMRDQMFFPQNGIQNFDHIDVFAKIKIIEY